MDFPRIRADEDDDVPHLIDGMFACLCFFVLFLWNVGASLGVVYPRKPLNPTKGNRQATRRPEGGPGGSF